MLNCKVNGSPVRKTRRNGEVDRLTSVAGGAVAFVKLGLSCSSPLTGIGVEVEVATLSGVGKGVSDINASEGEDAAEGGLGSSVLGEGNVVAVGRSAMATTSGVGVMRTSSWGSVGFNSIIGTEQPTLSVLTQP